MLQTGLSVEFKVDHSYLASPYHAGMIAGLALIADRIDKWLCRHEQVCKVVRDVPEIGLWMSFVLMLVVVHSTAILILSCFR